jgi:hypothetical protein
MKKKTKEIPREKKKYIIKVEYKTGDSFHSYDTSTILEDWNDIEVAKENLQRIKEHYEFYDMRDSFKLNYLSKKEKKKWEEKFKNPPPFVVIKNELGLSYPSLKIKEDDGSEYSIFPDWCGYFERLYGAEVQLRNDCEGDDSLKFRR